MQTIREVMKARNKIDSDIQKMFNEFADLTQEGMQPELALAKVFDLGAAFVKDGELSQYFNGKEYREDQKAFKLNAIRTGNVDKDKLDAGRALNTHNAN